MSHEFVDNVVKYTGQYYDIGNIYILSGEKSLTISISDPRIKDRTLVGLGIIESLATLCLEEGIDRDLITSAIWRNSRDKGDLGDILSGIVSKEVNEEPRK